MIYITCAVRSRWAPGGLLGVLGQTVEFVHDFCILPNAFDECIWVCIVILRAVYFKKFYLQCGKMMSYNNDQEGSVRN